MKNRYTIYLFLLGIIFTGVFAIAFTEHNLQSFIVDSKKWCNVQDSICITEKEKVILSTIVLSVFAILLLFEIFLRYREKEYISFERNLLLDHTAIYVSNIGYEIVENCFVKIKNIHVLGTNGSCTAPILIGERNEVFRWKNGSKTVNLHKGMPEALDIYSATNEKFELLFQDMSPLRLPVHESFRQDKTLRTAIYQLEIEFHGTAKNNGGADNVVRKTFWKIDYQSSGNGPSVIMRKIKKMTEINLIPEIEPVPKSARITLTRKPKPKNET